MEPLTSLLGEYKDDAVFKAKIEKLCESYKSLRRVRPDGNCFFRGFGFGYFERLLNEPDEWKKLQGLVKESKAQLLAQGFPKFTLEDFHDSVSYYLLHARNVLKPIFSSLWMLSTALEGRKR